MNCRQAVAAAGSGPLMAITLVATPDPPPSTRVIIRRVAAPRDTRRGPRPVPLADAKPGSTGLLVLRRVLG